MSLNGAGTSRTNCSLYDEFDNSEGNVKNETHNCTVMMKFGRARKRPNKSLQNGLFMPQKRNYTVSYFPQAR